MKQKTTIVISKRTRAQIDELARRWQMDGEGARYMGNVIEAAVAQTALIEQLRAEGVGLAPSINGVHVMARVAEITLSQFMSDQVSTLQRDNDLVRRTVYDLAVRFGLSSKRAGEISEMKMEG